MAHNETARARASQPCRRMRPHLSSCSPRRTAAARCCMLACTWKTSIKDSKVRCRAPPGRRTDDAEAGAGLAKSARMRGPGEEDATHATHDTKTAMRIANARRSSRRSGLRPRRSRVFPNFTGHQNFPAHPKYQSAPTSGGRGTKLAMVELGGAGRCACARAPSLSSDENPSYICRHHAAKRVP